MIKRSLMKNNLMVKRFCSNKNDYYVFNKFTNKYEKNIEYIGYNYLSPFESFILYPVLYTKTLFKTLFSKF